MTLALCVLVATAAFARGVDFNREIRPLLSENCFQCHGPDAAQRKADLRLDTEEGARQALIAGKPDESLLIERVFHEDPEERMPPSDSQQSLTESERETLREWIAQGAPWAKHWAFLSPIKRDLPEVNDKSWSRGEIDHFVLKRMEEAGLTPSPEAGRATLIRRLALDLTGLPPSMEEVEDFVNDDSEDAYDHLVTRLFRSPRYGEHMAWQWLEAARYADTDGYQNDGPREMWPWRDWVIDAYNENMPFDRFTVEQLAGDLLPNPKLSQRIATGFNRNHRYNSESGLVLEEFLLENAVDRVDTTSTVWMGLTAGCARCHDHKYDPLSQKEYYQLIAYFNNVPESGRAIKFGNSEPWIKAPTRDQQLEHKRLEKAVEQARAALGGREHAFLESDLTLHESGVLREPKQLGKVPGLICNGRFSIAFHMQPDQVNDGAILSNEVAGGERQGILVSLHEGHLRFQIITRWIAGAATVETVQAFEPNQAVHIALTNDGTQRAKGMRVFVNGSSVETHILHNTNSNKSTDKHGGNLRFGESAHIGPYEGEIHDLRIYTKRTLTEDEIEMLAAGRDLGEANERDQLAMNLWEAEEALLAFEDSLPTTMVMEERAEPRPTFLRNRGLYDDKGDRVERDTPAVFPAMPEEYPRNRLGFAQWLVSGEHPLTARVTVNRYWQSLFGRGLVKTAEDFGAQGSPPSHPGLLDWLAVDFMEHGWDVQHLLRQIVTSATYRQASKSTAQHRQQDPENILLSRSVRRRLSGNVLRDQALLASGLLVEKQGGPSVKPYQPAKLWREASNFSYQVGNGSDLYRRSLYTYWKRTLAPPAMAMLDTADREWCSVSPKRTNTPLQALTLLNETSFYEAARHLGERLVDQEGTPEDQVAWAFRLVTSRLPETGELQILTHAFDAYRAEFSADPAAARKALKVGQSKPPKDGDSVLLAAATTLANVLLNLDEVTTRE